MKATPCHLPRGACAGSCGASAPGTPGPSSQTRERARHLFTDNDAGVRRAQGAGPPRGTSSRSAQPGSWWADGLSLRGGAGAGGLVSSPSRALTPSPGLPSQPHLNPLTSRRPRLLTPALGSGASAYAFGGPRDSTHDEHIREKSNARGCVHRVTPTHVGVSDVSITLKLGGSERAGVTGIPRAFDGAVAPPSWPPTKRVSERKLASGGGL